MKHLVHGVHCCNCFLLVVCSHSIHEWNQWECIFVLNRNDGHVFFVCLEDDIDIVGRTEIGAIGSCNGTPSQHVSVQRPMEI